MTVPHDQSKQDHRTAREIARHYAGRLTARAQDTARLRAVTVPDHAAVTFSADRRTAFVEAVIEVEL